jgi:nucleotide-binding universal stress UspA family protein
MTDVVPVGADDSPTARCAIEAAAEIVEMSDGTLHNLSACEPKVLGPGSPPCEFENLNNEDGIDALLQVLSFITESQGIPPALHAMTGDPADAPIKKADELGADLVVVGHRGMKGVHRVLGSVPSTVAHGVNCSVIVVDTTE